METFSIKVCELGLMHRLSCLDKDTKKLNKHTKGLKSSLKRRMSEVEHKEFTPSTRKKPENMYRQLYSLPQVSNLQPQHFLSCVKCVRLKFSCCCPYLVMANIFSLVTLYHISIDCKHQVMVPV